MMKVYGNMMTPTTQMVLSCFAEKGDRPEFIHVELARGEQRMPAHQARHPFGLIPVLEEGAFTLHESRAIVRYLDRVLPGPALTPSEPDAYGTMEQFIGIEQAYFSPSVMLYFYARALGRDPGPERLAEARTLAARAIDVAEAALARGPYLAGEMFSLADLVWRPYLAIAEWTGNADLLQRPHVAEWWARLRERPAWASLRQGSGPAGVPA